MQFRDLQYKIGSASEDNGWHDRFFKVGREDCASDKDEHIITKLMLINSELVEAMDELRNGNSYWETYESEGGKPEGFPVELADVVIRAMDLAHMLGIDLEGVIEDKLEFNATRGKMHGGKKF